MQIKTIGDYRRAIRLGKYAWPGGYPLYFICDDGAALCCACAKSERRNIIESIADNSGGGWRVVGIDINYEDDALHCDHCGDRIESAYAE